MTTVFDVLAGVGPNLPGAWRTGTVEAGATTYLADSTIGGSNNVWNGGTALILWDVGGLGSAPQGQSRLISGYTAKGTPAGKVTVGTAFTVAPAAGDKYGLIKKRYPKDLILGKLNEALSDIWLDGRDESLTAVTSTKRYLLPDGINKSTLLQVWLAQNSSNPYDWLPWYYWDVEYDSSDTNHYLLFADYPNFAGKIRLVYMYHPDQVWADADEIDGRIDASLITSMTQRRVLEWRYNKFTVPPQRETNALNRFIRDEASAIRDLMPRMPAKQVSLTPTSLYYP